MLFQGYKIFDANKSDIFFGNDARLIINTINPHSFMVARKDEVFESALKTSDILLVDGIGIVFALRFIEGEKVKKITGPQFLEYSLEYYNRISGRVFFLGSSDNVLNSIVARVNESFPNIDVGAYSPPYSDIFSMEENDKMVDRVNEFSPDILFVGMTAPKQEKWVFANKDKVVVCHIASVGAAFDWFSGIKTPPSKLVQRLNLVWLERIVKEPVRMLPRLISMLRFILYVFRVKLYK